jgi:hypothetical protein
MATRSLNVVITGDSKGIGLAAREAEGHLRVVQRSAKLTGAALKLGFGVAAGGVLLGVGALKKSVDAAKEAETSQARLKAQLKSSGISYRAHAQEIDAVIQKHSKLAGIDDEDLQDAFTNLVRSTGSVTKSMQDMGLVTDIARAKHIGVTKAADLLGKVHAGNTAILKRYGIAFDPVTTAQDKLKESNKKATDEQVKAAKAADKTATSQQAVAELQKRFGGQAEAYGKTAAGAQERFGVAVENVEEKLGSKLLPVFAKVTNGVATFIQQMDSGKGAGGRFAAAISTGFNAVKTVIQRVVAAVRKYLAEHRQDIQDVIRAFKRVAEFARSTWQETLLPIVRRTVNAIKPILEGLISTVRGLVRLVSGLLSGNWSKAWSGAKEAVRGAWRVIKTVVSTGAQNLWDLVKDLGPKLVKAIVRGLANMGKALATGIFNGIKAAAKAVPGLAAAALKGIGGTILDGITGGLGGGVSGAIKKLVGDGIGKSAASGSLPSVGAFGGSLKGARSSLAPFAAIGSRFGLSVSDGKRPAGTRTSSGGISYHSTGEAIDMADGRGPDSNKLAFFKYLKSHFGGRLAELIYTPGGQGIKDGHPFQYTGSVAADHYDHVHVAFDSGKPGLGDGLGRRGPQAESGDGIGFRGLEDLWVRAGGGAKLAPLMAHIAQAESGGDPTARNKSGASGLWQILGQPFKGNPFNPSTNASMAVWKYKQQGLGAWAASRGKWGKFVGSRETYSPSKTAVKQGRNAIGSKHTSTVGNVHADPTVLYPDTSPSDEQRAAAGFRQRLAYSRKHGGSGPPGPRVLKGSGPLADPSSGDTGGDTGDPNQPLIDAQNAAKEAADALAAELKAVRESLDAQTAFATSVSNTSNFQLNKYLADIVSGRIVGYGVAGRAFTPGTGVEYAW